jgi:hypothetical protein
MPAQDLETFVAKEILVNEFKKYVGRHGLSSGPLAVDAKGFAAVIKSYSLPGIMSTI